MSNLYKKGDGRELSYIVGIVVFFAILLVGSQIFLKPIYEKKSITESSSWSNKLLDSIFNGISSIPVFGGLLNLILFTVQFTNVHPFVSIIIGAFIGIPTGYIILKVIRGGG